MASMSCPRFYFELIAIQGMLNIAKQYKTDSGHYGLIENRCGHNKPSMVTGRTHLECFPCSCRPSQIDTRNSKRIMGVKACRIDCCL